MLLCSAVRAAATGTHIGSFEDAIQEDGFLLSQVQVLQGQGGGVLRGEAWEALGNTFAASEKKALQEMHQESSVQESNLTHPIHRLSTPHHLGQPNPTCMLQTLNAGPARLPYVETRKEERENTV